jgi:hypothetical protein
LELHARLDEPERVGEEDHDNPRFEGGQQVVHGRERLGHVALLLEEAVGSDRSAGWVRIARASAIVFILY